MPPVEYHNIAQAHAIFKEIIDRLKAQKISRDDIHHRLKPLGRTLTKSTITRLYNDPAEGKTHSLKLLLRYTDWIKEAYPKELGLEVAEPIGEYGHLQQSIDLLFKEVKALRRLNRAALIRRTRSRNRRK